MGDDKLTCEHLKMRPALADVSNRLGKKGLLIIHGQPGRKLFRDGVSHNVDDSDKDLHFVHKLCQGVENVVKERCGSKRNVEDNNKGKKVCISPPTCIEINSLKRNDKSSISKVPFEANQTTLVDVMMSREDKCSKVSGDATDSFVGAGDKTEDCGTTSISKVIGPRPLVGSENNVKEVFADNLVLSQEGSVGFPIIHTSQDSNIFALERCTNVNEKCSSMQSDIDLIKTCSCSFCVKAAYIWSDLVYLDVKGRISALQKSQKEANILAVRNSTTTKGNGIVHGPKSSVKCSKMESDLTCQWRSLFHYMENTLASEASQLESSLVELNDLREDYKTNMEEINARSVRKQ